MPGFELDEALAILDRTPAVLRAYLAGLPDAVLHADEGPETWSPFLVLGHLIHGEQTDWVARARIILEHGEARPFDPFDRTAHLEACRGRELDDMLDEFERLRADNLATVRGMNLSEADLDRRGTHPALGTVTLRELLATWAAHDLGHIVQIARVSARHFGPYVGPWREYISVL